MNKTLLILSIFINGDRHIFLQKTHVFWKIEIISAIISHISKFLILQLQ